MTRSLKLLIAAAGLALAACQQQPVLAQEAVIAAPSAKRISNEAPGLKTAIFAGGCFWGVEGVFSHTRGVTSAVAGYHGGTGTSASYRVVSSGLTDHAEAVRVTYDPKIIRYDQLLRIFFSVIADPTLKNRQGPDAGPQYRAALIPMNREQQLVAAAYLGQMQASGKWSKPIVTGIEPYRKFYPAEDYHQDFMLKNPRQAYIARWDMPKLAAFKRLYPALYSARFARN